MNVVILTGRLGSDPNYKSLDSGKDLCKLSVATSRSYTKRDGTREQETDWHDVVVWGSQAKACSNHLKKGQMVEVVGSVKYRSWEDQDGNKRRSTEIIAREVNFGPKAGGKSSEEPEKKGSSFSNDDLPF
jgi:single-strand DNA-binding protein